MKAELLFGLPDEINVFILTNFLAWPERFAVGQVNKVGYRILKKLHDCYARELILRSPVSSLIVEESKAHFLDATPYAQLLFIFKKLYFEFEFENFSKQWITDISQLLVLSGCFESIENYLQHHPKAFAIKNDFSQHLLHFAALSGNTKTLAWIQAKAPWLYQCDNEGRHLLHFACLSGVTEMVILVSAHLTEKQKSMSDHQGRHAFHYAVMSQQKKMILYVHEHFPLGPDVPDALFQYPIHFAALTGNLSVFKLVHMLSPKLIFKTNREDCNVLHLACMAGRVPLVQFLRNQFPKLNITANLKRRPMYFACLTGALNLVRYLIESENVYCFELDEDKRNALHLACLSGNFELVEYLIRLIPSLNDVDHFQATPLHFAARGGDPLSFTHVIKKDSDFSLRDIYQRTPLHEAAAYGHLAIVIFLLQRSKNLGHDQDLYGNRLLHFAVRRHIRTALYVLIQFPEQIMAKNLKGMLPMHVAASFGNLESLRLLIEEKGCDPRLQDNKGRGLIHYAMISRNFLVFQYCVAILGFNTIKSAIHLQNKEIIRYKVSRLKVVRFFDATDKRMAINTPIALKIADLFHAYANSKRIRLFLSTNQKWAEEIADEFKKNAAWSGEDCRQYLEIKYAQYHDATSSTVLLGLYYAALEWIIQETSTAQHRVASLARQHFP